MQTTKVFLLSVALVLGHLVGFSSDLLTDCSNPELRTRIINNCVGEIGQRETLGANDSPRIREYKALLHYTYKVPVPWCAIFVAWDYIASGVPLPALSGNPAYVPNWSKDPRYVIYTRGAKTNKMPCAGDVVTYYSPRQGIEFHIAIIKIWPPTGDYFYTVEGNTNNAGSDEGDGVYLKLRRKSDAYKIMRFV